MVKRFNLTMKGSRNLDISEIPEKRAAVGLISREVEICNARGLHARAAARFVKCAETFDANIQVTKDDQTVGGTSIMGLMMLAAAKGSRIRISAEGKNADEALDALENLICERFGEKD